MHDHHGSSADAGGGLDLLPLWLQVLWALVMGAVLAHHVIAVGSQGGTARIWTAAHAVLSTGMLYMFLPWPHPPLGPAVLVTAYGCLLAATLTVLAADWILTGSVQLLGLLIAMDCAAMAYMSRMSDSGILAITYALVAYYCVAALVSAQRTPGRRLRTAAAQVGMAGAMAYMFLAMAWSDGGPTGLPAISYRPAYGAFACLLVGSALAYWLTRRSTRRPGVTASQI